jgi:hypothetical protein
MIVASIEGREKSLKKLVSSIQNFNEDYDYKIIIIRQYKNQKFVMKNNKVNLININEFGASNARNIGLRVVKKMIEKNDWVCFPDDDCFFGKNVLGKLSNFGNYDLVFGDIRDLDDKFRMGLPVKSKNLLLSKSFPLINCPSFFVKASKILNLEFNEHYGPGAIIPAVEETEFLYRLSQIEDLNCFLLS